jgi:hypothetical protein
MVSVRRWLLAGLVAAVVPAGAQAKDYCVSDSQGGLIKFRKVSSFKKVGSMVALHGLLIAGASGGGEGPIEGGEGEGEGEGSRSAPIVGTAVTLPDGTVKVGVYELGSGVVAGLSTASASLITDLDLNGTGAIDFDADGVQDVVYAWQTLDCDEFDLLAGF